MNMVDFIRSHDAKAEHLANGRLLVASWCRFADGRCGWVEETIPATWSAIRDWLRY